MMCPSFGNMSFVVSQTVTFTFHQRLWAYLLLSFLPVLCSHRVKDQRSILRTIKRRKTNWIGHILPRNCLLKHNIQEDIERAGKRRRRRKQLLNFMKEKIVELKKKRVTRSQSLENSLWKRL
jgi:hypothetical protein